MKKTNILLLVADQWRGDTLGCAGHEVVQTPNLDALAARGFCFKNAYSAVPSCIPARASLITGQSQNRTGIYGMGLGQKPMRDDYEHTLPGDLAQAGYHTQGIGKMHFHPQRALNGFHNTILDESGRVADPGFVSDYRSWFEENKPKGAGYRDHGLDWNCSWLARPTHLPEWLHPTHWTAEQSIRWLYRRDPNKPFFLMTSFARPHSPFDPPQVYFDLYQDLQMPAPYVGEWAQIHESPQDAASITAWRGKRTEREVQRARRGYYGSITFIDYQIGRLLHELQRYHREAYENTWIIFTADHGEMLGDHHLWRKTYGYEGSANIPLIVCPPPTWQGKRGIVLDAVVELRDLMPTILDICGIKIPETCDGLSFLPLLQGENPPWREYLHGEHCLCYSHEQAMHYLTDGKEKYIWFPYLGTEQLFDLVNDPGEEVDLAAKPEYKERLELWRKRLVSELAAREGLVKGGRLQKKPIPD
ncbi:MAG: arylsulfatase [Firmicutes bacterium]|nr:arylsulfatase [Bacillota bacterium]